MKLKLHFICIIVISAVRVMLSGFFPLILSIFFSTHNAIIPTLIIINNKLLKNTCDQIRNLFTSQILNSIIMDSKNLAIKTYISSNQDSKVELGQIRRLPEHLHKIINTSFTALTRLCVLLISVRATYYSILFKCMLPALSFYAFMYILIIRRWIPMIKSAYDAENLTNFNAIFAIKYKNQFYQSESLYQNEVTEKLNQEYKAYNKQIIYIRSLTLLLNIALYTYFSILLYAKRSFNIDRIYILHGAMMTGIISGIFGGARYIIGLLHGIALDVQPKTSSSNIQFCGIEFTNVFFDYNKKQITQNLSFEIKQNECISICGKNGSGKTTLCKLIAGIILPKSGEITNGNFQLNLKTQDTWKKYVIYKDKDLFVFQSELEQLRNNKIWLEFFPEKYHLLLQNEFSSGEHNFLSISAAALDEKIWILILDESLDCLDNETRIKLIAFIRKHVNSIVVVSSFEIEHTKCIKLVK